VRDVLRLNVGDTVEVFDDGGQAAKATLASVDAGSVTLHVQELIEQPARSGIEITIASAVPKGDRADWMIEKLSELGVARFIPLVTERSVVHPTGKSKSDRWTRLAIESAKQSHRTGVMQIDPLTPMADVLKTATTAWFMSTQGAATPITMLLRSPSGPTTLMVFVGPEGGWADEEITHFNAVGAIGVALTPTILRIETAAVATAAVLGCWSIPAQQCGD